MPNSILGRAKEANRIKITFLDAFITDKRAALYAEVLVALPEELLGVQSRLLALDSLEAELKGAEDALKIVEHNAKL